MTSRQPGQGSNQKAPRRPHGEGRQALLEAVVRVVARDGFDGLTYRAVAAEAGVTHGLVHYHFRGMASLVAETLTWAVEEAMQSTIETLAEGDSIEHFGSGLGHLIESQPEAQTFQNELLLAACRRPELRPQMDALFETYWQGLERTLQRAGLAPSPALVRLVFAAMNGLVLQQLYFGSRAETDEAIRELRRLLSI